MAVVAQSEWLHAHKSPSSVPFPCGRLHDQQQISFDFKARLGSNWALLRAVDRGNNEFLVQGFRSICPNV